MESRFSFLTGYRAGIGFGTNGDLALDMIEEGFISKFERFCIGNKPEDAQNIFFEGMILEEGLGMHIFHSGTNQ